LATEAVEGSLSKTRRAAPVAVSASAPETPRSAAAAAAAPATAVLAAPAPSPTIRTPELTAQAEWPARLSFTKVLSTTVRTQDFRSGVPSEFRDGDLPSRLTDLANPYLPENRRIFKVRAIAPHPGGGIVFWADARSLSSTEDSEEWSGLWRMEADGRVTALAVENDTQFQRARRHCDSPFDKTTVGRPDALIVEPGESIVAAQSTHGVILRVHRNGLVERIAGGGEDWCTRNNPSDTGYRDGPGAQALFSNELAIAQAPDGGIYVTEQKAEVAQALTRIRHIDAQGGVTTVYVGEDCSGGHLCPPRTVGVDSIAVDRDGQLLLAAQRLGRNARGQFQGHSTAYRFDPATGKASLLALAANIIPLPGVPFNNFAGVALLPDGRPVTMGLDEGGLVLLDGEKPTLHFLVKWGQSAMNDGPVATSQFSGRPFCIANDGSIYSVMSDHSLRRLDPGTQRVSTWLR
jgi:hypothetical protein